MNKTYTAITALTMYAFTMLGNAAAAPKPQITATHSSNISAENPTIIRIEGLGQGLVYLIDPKYSRLELNASKTTNAFGYFIKKAESNHNGTLEAIVTGTFFEPTIGKSVGLLVSNHKLITNGTSKYGTNFVYDNGKVCLVDNYENGWTQYETVIGGLARLVRHEKLAIDSTLKRGINPYSSVGRCAIGLTNKGKIKLVFYTGSVPNLAKYLIKIGCREAAQLDSGNSRAFYIKRNGKGHVTKRDNSERRIKTVIEVMKIKQYEQQKNNSTKPYLHKHGRKNQ